MLYKYLSLRRPAKTQMSLYNRAASPEYRVQYAYGMENIELRTRELFKYDYTNALSNHFCAEIHKNKVMIILSKGSVDTDKALLKIGFF